MKKVFLLVAVVLLASNAYSRAKTWENKKHKVSFEVDESLWTVHQPKGKPELLFGALCNDESEKLGLALLTAPLPLDDDSMSADFVRGFEDTMSQDAEKQGSKVEKLRGAWTTIAGVPAYEGLYKVVHQKGVVHSLWRLLMANNRLYMMGGTDEKFETDTDPKLLALMNSFEFTTKPRFKPANMKPSRSSSGIVDEHSEAYQMGYLAGMILIGLLVLAWLISFLRRMSKKKAAGG